MATSSGEPFIGVDYGLLGTKLPSYSEVVKLLSERGVNNVKIYDANQDVLKAFKASPTEFKLSVAVPNHEVVAMAKDQNIADHWVNKHIVKFKDIITSIGMGNEWLHANTRGDPSKLVPAMEKLYIALKSHNLHNNIQVSTPHAFDVTGFPPSRGEFRDKTVMTSLLSFLKRTNSFFMLNVYPFFPYADDPNIRTDYALFTATNPVVVDAGSKLRYTNMFDAMLDTAIFAMKDVGYPDMPIVITETGWPNGGSTRRGVGIENARVYNQNVIKHVLPKKGTPLRPRQSFPTYIFALFNEDRKSGGHQDEEKYWGHFHPNMTPVYALRMSG